MPVFFYDLFAWVVFLLMVKNENLFYFYHALSVLYWGIVIEILLVLILMRRFNWHQPTVWFVPALNFWHPPEWTNDLLGQDKMPQVLFSILSLCYSFNIETGITACLRVNCLLTSVCIVMPICGFFLPLTNASCAIIKRDKHIMIAEF